MNQRPCEVSKFSRPYGTAIGESERKDPVAEPLAVVTVTVPVVVPAGTVQTICVALPEVTVALAVPLSVVKVTEVGEARFVPVMVTDEPGSPASGEIELIVGTGILTPVESAARLAQSVVTKSFEIVAEAAFATAPWRNDTAARAACSAVDPAQVEVV